MIERLRRSVRRARLSRPWWLATIDTLRALFHAEGRALLWVDWRHRGRRHQRSTLTAPDRYPALFDALAERVATDSRLLSFGCSSGEELLALRRRLPAAQLVGAEINPLARRRARAALAADPNARVVPPHALAGRFDAILALAVFQRDAEWVEGGVPDIARHYPFALFDDTLAALVERLKPGGWLAVDLSFYRVEDSRAAAVLEPVEGFAASRAGHFLPDGRRPPPGAPRPAASLFRKREALPAAAPGPGPTRPSRDPAQTG